MELREDFLEEMTLTERLKGENLPREEGGER